ncbi:DUF397 domain-containing protein [Streptoalloteichus hindustanus]|uniref:DUF397 domain-containing protein n=1 Tax=Streptoalloteichus hindustanus TaxID=2017 RepID=UPI001F284824
MAFVPTWRKSSYSSTKENCVEVTLARGEVTVRDSKNPSGAALTFSQNSFGAFVSSVRSGHLG